MSSENWVVCAVCGETILRDRTAEHDLHRHALPQIEALTAELDQFRAHLLVALDRLKIIGEELETARAGKYHALRGSRDEGEALTRAIKRLIEWVPSVTGDLGKEG